MRNLRRGLYLGVDRQNQSVRAPCGMGGGVGGGEGEGGRGRDGGGGMELLGSRPSSAALAAERSFQLACSTLVVHRPPSLPPTSLVVLCHEKLSFARRSRGPE